MSQLSETTAAPRSTSRLRARLGVAVIVVVVALAAWSLYGEREGLRHSLERLGVLPVVVAFIGAVLGVGATYLQWRAVLRGLEVELPLAGGARVYFVSQLGKYLPGSIWPVVMQMEEGRRHGASRAAVLAANLFTLLLGCTVGMLWACATLPLSSDAALRHYWWVLLALPFLLAVLHPRTVPLALNLALRVVRREPVALQVPARQTVRAAGWALVSFALLGVQLTVLIGPFAGWHPRSWLLATGTMALAICVGVLAIPVPAGAGVRDAVMAVSLAPTIGTAPALLAAVSSRILLSGADVVLALVMLAVAGRTVPARAPSSDHGPAAG